MMAVRRITTGRRELIRRLSDILSGFLPLTSHSEHAVTFNSIFAESKIDKYLEGPSKKKALQKAWENVFRLYPRLPYTLIRKIVPAAIEYRRYKRNPLKQAELDALSDCLGQLGMDMSKELREVGIDETIRTLFRFCVSGDNQLFDLERRTRLCHRLDLNCSTSY